MSENWSSSKESESIERITSFQHQVGTMHLCIHLLQNNCPHSFSIFVKLSESQVLVLIQIEEMIINRYKPGLSSDEDFENINA
jgi:hypothetical protein